MRRFVLENVWWITSSISLILLVCNTFSLAEVKVDTTTLVLLIILLISPFASNLKKIKFGDFEAEISPMEVQKVKEEAGVTLSEKDEAMNLPELDKIISNIKILVKQDAVIALAKLRIELEMSIARLCKLVMIKQSSGKRAFTLSMMIRELTLREVLPKDISAPLNQVIYLCNRAIHGEDIRQQDAETVVDIGVSSLSKISSLIQDLVVKPHETLEINHNELEGYLTAKYRVTTVIPYADAPVKQVRHLTQDELSELIEGYGDYAECIVDIQIEK
ncbi:hypothetical protein SAMN05660742_12916 [Propionispira arboris]|uniref:DUF4145 domain-containing protein n=1 Tax=Propionispira arboris TaxID=84035 RepID=A0A1H7D2K1_9FIRM|nr:hypothetical protein [Propionispira arboris]SEJ95991.1 hypothetical protein SAMN05660742_12916 [Propionispira arboris]